MRHFASDGTGKERHGDRDSTRRVHRRRVDSGRRRGDPGHEPGDGRGARHGAPHPHRPRSTQRSQAAVEAFPAWRRVSLLERVELCRTAFDLCMERAEEIARDDHAGGRQDHPRVARGDGRVHGRPLPPRVRGRPPPRGQGAAVDAGAFERTSGSSSRRSRSASSRPSRRGTSPSTSPASRSSTAWRSDARPSGSRPSTRRSARTCSPRSSTTPASRRGRSTSSTAAVTSARAGAPPRRGRGRLHRLVDTGEQVARDAALKNRVLELGGNGPQIVLADATSTRPPTLQSSAASTLPASAAPRPSASSCTSP